MCYNRPTEQNVSKEFKMYKLILTTIARTHQSVSVSTISLDFKDEITAKNAGQEHAKEVKKTSSLMADVTATFVVVPGDEKATQEKYGTP